MKQCRYCKNSTQNINRICLECEFRLHKVSCTKDNCWCVHTDWEDE